MNDEDFNTFDNDEIHPGLLWTNLHQTANCGIATPVTEIGIPIDGGDDVSTLWSPQSQYIRKSARSNKVDDDDDDDDDDDELYCPQDAASGFFTKNTQLKLTKPTTDQDIEQPSSNGSQIASTAPSSIGNTESKGSSKSKPLLKSYWKCGLMLACAVGTIVLILLATGVLIQNDKNGSSNPKTVSEESPENPPASNTPTRSPVVVTTAPSITKTVDSLECPICGPTRCGTSWTDANSRCGHSCGSSPDPLWNICSPCPADESCFADLSVHCCPASAPMTAPSPQKDIESQVPTTSPSTAEVSSSTTRCGTSWTDANSNCKSLCASRPDPGWETSKCPVGEDCFADLSGHCGNTSVGTPSVCSSSRCGTSWVDANNNCKPACDLWPNPGWDACATDELCYADLDTSQCCT